MPRRRLGGAFSGASQSIQQLVSLLMQNRMTSERQVQQFGREQGAKALDQFRTAVTSMGPEQVQSFGPEAVQSAYENLRRRLPASLQSLAGGEPDFAGMDKPRADKFSDVAKELGGVTNPDDLRLSRLGVRRRLEGAGVEPDIKVPNLYMGGGSGNWSGASVPDPDVEALIKQVEGQKEGLLAKEERTPTNYFDETGQQRTGFYSNREKGNLGSLNAERTTEQQGAREASIKTATEQAGQDVQNLPANQRGRARGAGLVAGAETGARAAATEAAEAQNFSAVLARKEKEYGTMTPLVAQRAASESFAKLPYEMEQTRQRIQQEAAAAGNKALLEESAKKTAAVKALMPIYQQYRQLALNVAQSPAGAGGPGAASALNTLSHLPAIGEFVASGSETALAALTTLGDPSLARQVTELDRLSDALAMSMANAVLGNKGQTTENDRRAAKKLLASSFTDAKTVGDLLDITDRMFMTLPEAAAKALVADPMATPESIFNQMAASKGQGAGAPSNPLTSAEGKWNARTGTR